MWWVERASINLLADLSDLRQDDRSLSNTIRRRMSAYRATSSTRWVWDSTSPSPYRLRNRGKWWRPYVVRMIIRVQPSIALVGMSPVPTPRCGPNAGALRSFCCRCVIRVASWCHLVFCMDVCIVCVPCCCVGSVVSRTLHLELTVFLLCCTIVPLVSLALPSLFSRKMATMSLLSSAPSILAPHLFVWFSWVRAVTNEAKLYPNLPRSFE